MITCACVSRYVHKEVERAGGAGELKSSLSEALDALFREERLTLVVNCLRERICAEGVRVSDGDVLMVFLKSEIICREPFPSSDSYDRALNVFKAWRT